MHTGQAVLAAIVIIPLLLALLGVLRHARGPAGKPKPKAGVARGWLAHRRRLRLERARHENASARDEARHRHRLREQRERDDRADARADRQGAGREDGGWRPRWRPRRRTVPGEVIPDDESSPWPEAPETGGTWPPDPHGDSPDQDPRRDWPEPESRGTWPELEPRTGEPFPRPDPHDPHAEPRQDSSPEPPWPYEPPARDDRGTSPEPPRPVPGTTEPIEGVIVTMPATAEAVPGVEQVAEGLRAIFSHAMAGNIQAKRRGILALVHVARTAAATAITLARAMGEQRHYGIEITERVSAMAMHFTAAGAAGGEADAMLGVLLRSSVEESMAAGRQMPHHDELQESGAY